MATSAQNSTILTQNNNNTTENNSNCTTVPTPADIGNCTPIVTPVPTPIPESLQCDNSGNATPETPVKEAGLIKITTIHITDNRETEYANVTNEGCYPVDLTGWKLETGCGVEYPLDGAVVQPSATLTVHSNTGKNSETDYYLNANTHIWVKGSGKAKLIYETDFKI